MEFHQPRMEIDGWFVMAHCCKYIQKREQLVDLSKLKRAISTNRHNWGGHHLEAFTSLWNFSLVDHLGVSLGEQKTMVYLAAPWGCTPKLQPGDQGYVNLAKQMADILTQNVLKHYPVFLVVFQDLGR